MMALVILPCCWARTALLLYWRAMAGSSRRSARTISQQRQGDESIGCMRVAAVDVEAGQQVLHVLLAGAGQRAAGQEGEEALHHQAEGAEGVRSDAEEAARQVGQQADGKGDAQGSGHGPQGIGLGCGSSGELIEPPPPGAAGGWAASRQATSVWRPTSLSMRGGAGLQSLVQGKHGVHIGGRGLGLARAPRPGGRGPGARSSSG